MPHPNDVSGLSGLFQVVESFEGFLMSYLVLSAQPKLPLVVSFQPTTVLSFQPTTVFGIGFGFLSCSDCRDCLKQRFSFRGSQDRHKAHRIWVTPASITPCFHSTRCHAICLRRWGLSWSKMSTNGLPRSTPHIRTMSMPLRRTSG